VEVGRADEGALLEKKAETAMLKHLGHAFVTIVRSIEDLREMLAGKGSIFSGWFSGAGHSCKRSLR
jgi:hypothetical protein